MYSLILSALTLFVSVVTALYIAKKDASDEDKQEIEKIEHALEGFYDNFLGWFNRIMDFSSSVLAAGRGRVLDKARIHDYRDILEQIKRDDKHYSRAHGFLDTNWDELLNPIRSVSTEGLSVQLRDLKHIFDSFEGDLFELKIMVGDLLQEWDQLDSDGRTSILNELETEMLLFEDYKDLVVAARNRLRSL